MLNALLAPLLFAAASGVVLTLDGPSLASSPNVEAPAAAQPSRVDVLLDRHDCWTGEAPADLGPYGPGHAVVTLNGQTSYASADTGYGIWLDGNPGILHGFCR